MVDVKGYHPDFEGFMSGRANEAEADDLRRFCKSPASRKSLGRAIEALGLSPEMKSYLKSLCEVTVKVGKTVLFVGRKLVEVLIEGGDRDRGDPGRSRDDDPPDRMPTGLAYAGAHVDRRRAGIPGGPEGRACPAGTARPVGNPQGPVRERRALTGRL